MLKTGYEIRPEDGGTTLLRNVGKQLPVYTAQLPRGLELKFEECL